MQEYNKILDRIKNIQNVNNNKNRDGYYFENPDENVLEEPLFESFNVYKDTDCYELIEEFACGLSSKSVIDAYKAAVKFAEKIPASCIGVTYLKFCWINNFWQNPTTTKWDEDVDDLVIDVVDDFDNLVL